ncbi:MAG: sugar ABC transporter permease [Clostridia bacterium]|nr:sugar ABC transporter permease [Clostridia bacterium]
MAKRKKGGFAAIVTSDKFAQAVFLFPAYLIFTVLFFIPVLTSVYYSFTDWNGITTQTNWVWFKNYADMFRNPDIFSTIPVTIYYAVLNSVTLIFVAFFVALTLNRKSRITTVLRISFFMPMLVSGIIVGFLFKEFYSPVISDDNMGTLNRLLTSLGLGGLTQNWLGNKSTVIMMIVLTGVWNQVGQTALIYLANMQSIPKELYEAAIIDGAGYWRQTYHITWKLISPSLRINLILLIINSLKTYDMIALLTGGGPGTASKVINLWIVERSIGGYEVGLGCAMSMVVTIFAFTLVTVTQKLLTKRGADI